MCLLPFDILHHFGNRYIQMSQAVKSNAYGFHLSKFIALLRGRASARSKLPNYLRLARFIDVLNSACSTPSVAHVASSFATRRARRDEAHALTPEISCWYEQCHMLVMCWKRHTRYYKMLLMPIQIMPCQMMRTGLPALNLKS
jgi:hypothetical protein